MKLDVKYRGRIATAEDVAFIKDLIENNPKDSRYSLSKKLCKAWNWVQPNGVLRDMVCRGYLLKLERAGYIKLPPRKIVPNNPFVNRKQPEKIEIDQSPIHKRLSEIQPLCIQQVRRTSFEKLYNSLIFQYHYLGYSQPVGEHLKYLVFTDRRVIACLAFCSSPRHIGCRDKFIGWSVEGRKKNLHLIAYNTRYLILPWIHVPHVASHILGRIVRILFLDWIRVYNHPIYFIDTFIDPERHKGTCYRASNWIFLGKTTGRGKDDQTHKQNRSIKDVWGYPLSKNFRETLQHE